MTDAEKEQIKDATDLVALVGETAELRQRGGHDFWGCCPFHDEKTPSFHVDGQKGFYKCFSCGESGDAFTFVMKRDGLSFPDAARLLANKANIEISENRGSGPARNRIVDAMAYANEYAQTLLMRSRDKQSAQARAFLGNHGLGSDVCKRWGLGVMIGGDTMTEKVMSAGYSRYEVNAAGLARIEATKYADALYRMVTLPARDQAGAVVALVGQPYNNHDFCRTTFQSKAFRRNKTLPLLEEAKPAIAESGRAIVVATPLEAVTLHEMGVTNAVCSMGRAPMREHLEMLNRAGATMITLLTPEGENGDRLVDNSLAHVGFISGTINRTTFSSLGDNLTTLAGMGSFAIQQACEFGTEIVEDALWRHLQQPLTENDTPQMRDQALHDTCKAFAAMYSCDQLTASEVAGNIAYNLGMRDSSSALAIMAKGAEELRSNPKRGFPRQQPSVASMTREYQGNSLEHDGGERSMAANRDDRGGDEGR